MQPSPHRSAQLRHGPKATAGARWSVSDARERCGGLGLSKLGNFHSKTQRSEDRHFNVERVDSDQGANKEQAVTPGNCRSSPPGLRADSALSESAPPPPLLRSRGTGRTSCCGPIRQCQRGDGGGSQELRSTIVPGDARRIN
ncbi:hypothetical protein AAFF_G00183160 [Aldrovandia affinis]|uniref:Uncharacterized protein n=1 Tax=Aldrovandia affinis TaxID=143900 RepID=A0AAD7RMT0_9TELE|nr:hypothetical protein AAFF_G00183160 [Aldrovandia affinis]